MGLHSGTYQFSMFYVLANTYYMSVYKLSSLFRHLKSHIEQTLILIITSNLILINFFIYLHLICLDMINTFAKKIVE